ncbi:DUF1624 domain-containing protein [Arthrobacter sp. I2-34]|uniref:DUF1624 domain-containing protein n=1 Tax=Arthrobacter hankyongi TaxID=2904801 RepID=A0ABS9L500_9MICC|nr:heparan-alpha-glucosaminide N-acetyltransferase domain-containing protein [Arthrobacter hankyongi]MCG2621710.1 DUF1624 domain-containing protein [Arthrobacter hankyongi]
MKDQKKGPASKRFLGVDAARGAALIGMMAIHIMPAWNDNGDPTLVWTFFAGKSAALFALLAGVSLTFSSGGARLLNGRALLGAQAGLAVRALLIGLLGLLLAYLNPPAAIILAYYGMMFLLAVPLLGLGPRALALAALGFAIVGPVLMQDVRNGLSDLDGFDPTLTSLITQPADVVGVLLFTGSYPVIPWMAYICAGLAIGRLDLGSAAVQIRLAVGGVVLAVGTWLLSLLLLGPLGGQERILAATPWLDAEGYADILTYGPDFGLPTTTGWWLAIPAPYSTTPLEILMTLGTGMAALGTMLLLARSFAWVLTPLATAGAITLTLYSGHLVLLATGLLDQHPEVALGVHLTAALLFAFIWRNVTGRRPGPLEGLVSAAVKRTRAKVLAAGQYRQPADPAGPDL